MVEPTPVEEAYHRLDADFVPMSTEATERDPTARLHLLRAAAARLWSAPFDPGDELAEADRLAGRPRDLSLARAFRVLLTEGPVGAVEPFVEHTSRFPGDPFASGLRTVALVMSGVRGNRERAFALTERDASSDGGDWHQSSVLAMVREEQGRFEEARRLAEGALSQEPRAAHAVHALTHVNYETGEHAEGMGWLDGWQAGRPMLGYGTHFRWHAALHALALGDVEGALHRYAEGIGPQALPDAGSLLWRCRLAGTPAPEESAEARQAALPVIEALPVAFAVFNACLALAAASDMEGLRAVADRLAGDARPGFADLVGPIALALAQILEGRPDRGAEQLEPVLRELPRVGGSNAQREVVEDTYIHALLRCGRTAEAVSLIRARLDRREHQLDRRLIGT